MEVAQIRYFVKLCQERSFTRAAERCGVSQPSLSNGVRTLESELGGVLFDRTRVRPTDLGKRILPHLEAVLVSLERVRKAAAAVRRNNARRILSRAEPSGLFVAAMMSGKRSKGGEQHPQITL
jgi:DNA-binding transcriptional LysR family regulator